MALQILCRSGKRVHNAHVEPLAVLLDHPCKIAARVAVVQEHGQAGHLGQFELEFKVLDLGLLWAKEQAVVI